MAAGTRARRSTGGALRAATLFALVALFGLRCTCEPVDLEGARFACASDLDCADGNVCGADGVCAPPGGEDGGCNPAAASEEVCKGGVDEDCDGVTDCADPDCERRACSDDGALACHGGACACGVIDVEIDPGAGAGGNVVSFDGRLAWIYGGEDGGIFYGECEGRCDAPTTQLLDAPAYPKQRPALKAQGQRLIAAWRQGGGAMRYAECAGNCLDGGFQRVSIEGLQVGAMPPDISAAGSARAIIAMDQSGRVIWIECADQCLDAAQWSAQLLTGSVNPRGVASLLWEEDGGTRRLAAYGGPLVTRRCDGTCGSATEWSPALTLDSDAFQPELQRNDAGRVAIFARSEALKKLFSYVCEPGRNCAAPQSWAPVVAWSYPADTRQYDSSVTPDGRFAFATSGPVNLFVGEETSSGYVSDPVPLCDGGTLSAWEPAGFVDSSGRWTILYHAKDGSMRLYLPRP